MNASVLQKSHVPVCTPSIRTQTGSALIIAMLVAALVSVISVRFAEAFLLQLDNAEFRQQMNWRSTYVQGAEALAVQLLQADAQQSQTDHLQEIWAQQIPALPTDHGWLQPALYDAQARFNLNNLLIKTAYADDAGAPLATRLSPAQKQFVRLLQSFEDYPVSEADAVMMTEALVDWIDADDDSTGQGGAESLFYSAASPPLQAANQPLSDISELLLVRHFTPALVERLRALVVVLPMLTALNLNTAPLPLLATINRADHLQPLSWQSLQALQHQRQTQAFSSVDAFFQHPLLQQLVPDAERSSGDASAPLFSVASQWFLLDSTVAVNGTSSRWQSLIYRPGNHNTAGADPAANTTPRLWSRSRQY